MASQDLDTSQPLEKASTQQTVRHPGFWVPSLYVAEGVPFIAANVMSVFMYKSLGLSDAHIAAFTSMIGLPWMLKPLWSPFMEMFKTKKYFVLATQFFGGVFFALLAFSLPADNFVRYSLACFALIAFSSATHDIAADGLYIESLSPEQQAKWVGFQGGFWNVGKFLVQFGLVTLAGRLEKTIGVKPAWMAATGLVGGLLVILSLYHGKVLPTGRTAQGVQSVGHAFREFWKVVVLFLKKKYVFWGLAFVILYRFAEGQAQKIFPLFLRADRIKGGLGWTTEDAGYVYGLPAALAFIFGSICGGFFAARGLRRSLMALCAIFNLPYLAYLFLVFVQPESKMLAAGAVWVEMFGYGFGFVGVTLFMMQQMATGPYKMAHYAIATSAMQLGLLAPGFWSGYLSDAIGYKMFFAWVMISTLASFLVTWLVPFKTDADIAKENAQTAS